MGCPIDRLFQKYSACFKMIFPSMEMHRFGFGKFLDKRKSLE